MHHMKKPLIALLLILTGATTIGAAQAEPLSVEEAVRRAIDRHPGIASSADSAAAALETVGQAESAYWPRLTLTSSYRYSGPTPELVIDTGVVVPGQTEPLVFENELGTPHNAQVGLQVGWRVFDWGARSAMVDAARASVAATSAEGESRAVEIAYAVRANYMAAQFYEEIVGITERALATANQYLLDRETRLVVGVGREVEVAAAAARVAELEARLVDAQGQQELARNTLELLMGSAGGAVLKLTDGLEMMQTRTVVGDPAASPQLSGLTALGEALDSQADATARSFWPTLDVGANAAYQFPETFVNTEEAGLAYSVGAILTWELFDGFQRRHREAELRNRVDATDNARAALLEELERSQIDAELRRNAARARADAAQRQLEAAEAYLRAATSALDSGAGTALDVLEAEGAIDAAHLSVLQARFIYAMATADLMRALGISSEAGPSASDGPID